MICGTLGAMRKVNICVPVPPALVAEIFATKEPSVRGVPLIRPVLALSVRPVGRLVTEYCLGLLVAVIW